MLLALLIKPSIEPRIYKKLEEYQVVYVCDHTVPGYRKLAKIAAIIGSRSSGACCQELTSLASLAVSQRLIALP